MQYQLYAIGLCMHTFIVQSFNCNFHYRSEIISNAAVLQNILLAIHLNYLQTQCAVYMKE